ncbi:MAG: 23S rRNA (pseudouridine(1915)-N(3))-methyltransferase RlmH [Candidatus Saccharimonadales bacterium]
MKIVLLVVGKQLDASLHKSVSKYVDRIQHYTAFEQIIIPASPPSPSSLRIEARAMLKIISSQDFICLLTDSGELYNNEQFAQKMTVIMQKNKKIIFILGGAYGVDDSIIRRANTMWSLSPLVFPHELARVIIYEQLYRTLSIINGHPYHHGNK